MRSSRKLECHGPCDEHGDPYPDGVARIGLFRHTSKARDHIVLDYGEAVMLLAELKAATEKIERNRETRFGGILAKSK